MACRLTFPYYILPEEEKQWPSVSQVEEGLLGQFKYTHGVMWIMMKFDPHEAAYSASRLLQSRIFFSTSEYAAIPEFAVDLLCPWCLGSVAAGIQRAMFVDG